MGLSKLFRSAASKLQPTFRQISKVVDRAPGVINQAGGFLSKAGGVISQAGNIADKVLENPITEAIVATNPELIPFYGGALGAANLAKQVGGHTSKAGNVTSQVGNTLERNKTVGGAIQAGIGAHQAYGSPSFSDVKNTVSSIRNTPNPFSAGAIHSNMVREGAIQFH